MIHCDINLAKGVIWTRMQRLLAYRLLMLYLLIMALLLIGLGVRSIHQVGAGFRYLTQSRQIDLESSRARPGEASLEKYAEQLRQKLETDSARIDSIHQALPSSLYTPLPALALMVNHSGRNSLHKLSFAQPTEKEPVRLVFGIITPNVESQRAFQNAWLADPALFTHFPDIKQLQVSRTEIGSREVMITQYEAVGKD